MAGILLNRSRQAPAEDTPAFGGIAERFRRAGDLDRAIALCRDGLKKFPDQLSARVTLGWSLLDKGQYEDARAELERVLRRAPDNLAAIRGMAELHDRSEGAMPSIEDHRESARSGHDEPDSPAISAAASSQSGGGLAAEDPFAPISVNFSANSSATPEIVHTAEDAGRAAQEAAASAAAMALLGVDRVAVDEPASAAMASALDFDAVAFDAGTDVPVAFEVNVGESEGSAFELESAADNLLSAASADEYRPMATVAVETSDLAETEELVASLQQFSVDDVAPANDLVLDVAGADDGAGLVDLAAFDATPAIGTAASSDTTATDFAGSTDLDDLTASIADAPATSTPLAAVATELGAAGEDDGALLDELAALDATPAIDTVSGDVTIAAFTESRDLEVLNAPSALTAEEGEWTTTAASELDADPAAVSLAAPLSDVQEVEPEPAFVPDLAFALEASPAQETPALEAGLVETPGSGIASEEGSPLALVPSESAFTPDVTGLSLDGHGFDALVGAPVAIEAPATDVLADADLAEPEPAFVPDLSAVALSSVAADELAALAAEREPAADVPAVAMASGSEPAFVPDLGFTFDAAPAQTEAVVVSIARPKPGLQALERFLRQVEARKLQLAQGSVA